MFNSEEDRMHFINGIKKNLKRDNPKRYKCQYYLLILEKVDCFEASIILSKLIDWEGKQYDKNNYYIYKTIKEFQKETGLNRYRQDKAITLLKDLKLISVTLKGIPATRYFQLNIKNLNVFIKVSNQEYKQYLSSLPTVNKL